MLVAILIILAAEPFEKKENALHYLLGYTILIIAGAGRCSLDNLIHNRLRLAYRSRNNGRSAVIPA
jgi:putative oxidoreductase